jgi:hypothetical protein
MPYKVGKKGSLGCSGYPAVKTSTGEVMGCHKTAKEAAAQIYAINRSEGNIGKAMPNLKEGDFAMTAHGSDEEVHIGQVVHVMREGILGVSGGEYTLEATPDNPAVLLQLFEQEEDGYWEATNLYTGCMMSLMVAIDPLPQEPEASEVAMAMYDSSIGKANPCWDGYVQRGMKEQNGKQVPNCVPVEKTQSLFTGIGKDYTRSTTNVYRMES